MPFIAGCRIIATILLGRLQTFLNRRAGHKKESKLKLSGKGTEAYWFEGESPWNVSLAVILAGLVVFMVILAWIPPISRDALIHHLAVPKLYLNNGGVYEIPFMDFSYYPMNLDLLYMIPLYFGQDIIPKIIHMAFAFLTA